MLMFPPCQHRLPVIGFYGDHCRTRQRTIKGNRNRGGDITGAATKLRLAAELMGINWMKWKEVKLAIPPAYSEYLGRQIIRSLKSPDPITRQQAGA
jgi:DNA (cytosine-5)-methyltransferase 1